MSSPNDFNQMAEQMPGFAEYQRNTSRQIPVVKVIWSPQRFEATNSIASFARDNHASADVGSTVTHSFMSRPFFLGSKCSPSPEVMSASTRGLGSLTTSLPLTSIAKILL